MTRHHSSRPDPWISPRQKRWNDWGHGPILPMDRPKDEWPIWAGVAMVLAVAVLGVFIAVMAG